MQYDQRVAISCAKTYRKAEKQIEIQREEDKKQSNKHQEGKIKVKEEEEEKNSFLLEVNISSFTKPSVFCEMYEESM